MKRNVLLILAMIASLMMSFIACDTKTPIDDPEEDPKQEQEIGRASCRERVSVRV